MGIRKDRWLLPGLVRIHLVMHGVHVGYVIVAESKFKRLLGELDLTERSRISV